MRICTTCVLPETFPGIRFDEQGKCQHCLSFKGVEYLESKRQASRERFEKLLDERPRVPGGYDVLVAYSGGKDSTFTLDLLTNHYGLRALALTFDHGFASPAAVANIHRVVESLGVDHMMFGLSPGLIEPIVRYSISHEFHSPKALGRASSICNSCMGLVRSTTLNIALEKKIPLIAYGWSPGQGPIQSAMFKNHPAFVSKAQKPLMRSLEQAVGPSIRSYFVDESVLQKGSFPSYLYNINPLSFLHYDEEEVFRRIGDLGWSRPADTDANSTNCLLNGFANEVHMEKYGYHPYAMELAGLVREGILARDEALERLSTPSDPRIVEAVKTRLGLTPEPADQPPR